MSAPTAISEVMGSAAQGMTRPSVGAAGECTYFVKSASAGKNSLCCEWLAGRLAKLLLPDGSLGLPDFQIAEVPAALIAGSERVDIRDLGAKRRVGRLEANLQSRRSGI